MHSATSTSKIRHIHVGSSAGHQRHPPSQHRQIEEDNAGETDEELSERLFNRLLEEGEGSDRDDLNSESCLSFSDTDSNVNSGDKSDAENGSGSSDEDSVLPASESVAASADPLEFTASGESPVFAQLEAAHGTTCAAVARLCAAVPLSQAHYDRVVECILTCVPESPNIPVRHRLPKAKRTIMGRFENAVSQFVQFRGLSTEQDSAMLELRTVILHWLSSPIIREEIAAITDETRDLILPYFSRDGDRHTVAYEDIFRAAGGVISRRWHCLRYFQAIEEYRTTWYPQVESLRKKYSRCTVHCHFLHLAFFFDGLPLFRRRTSDAFAMSATFINNTPHMFPAELRTSLHLPLALGKKRAKIQGPTFMQYFTNELVSMVAECPSLFVCHKENAPLDRPFSLLTHEIDVFIPLYFGCPVDGVARNEAACLQSIGLSNKMCSHCLFNNSGTALENRFTSRRDEHNVNKIYSRRTPNERAECSVFSQNGSRIERAAVTEKYGYVGYSPLWRLSSNMMSTLGIDTFHNEGENLIPKHFETCGSTFGRYIPEMWNVMCKNLQNFSSGENCIPSFASFKGWKWALNGRCKMESMVLAPLCLGSVLYGMSPTHAMFDTPEWRAIQAHSHITRIVMQKAMFFRDIEEIDDLRKELWTFYGTMYDALGKDLLVPTVHMCEHYVDQLTYLGILSSFTTFPFERIHKVVRQFSHLTNMRSVTKTILRYIHHRAAVSLCSPSCVGKLVKELGADVATGLFGFIHDVRGPQLCKVVRLEKSSDTDILMDVALYSEVVSVRDRILGGPSICAVGRTMFGLSYRHDWVTRAVVVPSVSLGADTLVLLTIH